jgi:hypothetical protein
VRRRRAAAGGGGGGGGARHGAPNLLSGHARETVEEDVLKEIDILKSLNQCARAHSAVCAAARVQRVRFLLPLCHNFRALCADTHHAAACLPARARVSPPLLRLTRSCVSTRRCGTTA